MIFLDIERTTILVSVSRDKLPQSRCLFYFKSDGKLPEVFDMLHHNPQYPDTTDRELKSTSKTPVSTSRCILSPTVSE